MNNFEKAIEGYLGEGNIKKVQSVRVGIAGCGGLGSNCAYNLVRSGFKRFTIVDFDKVEYSNLNRQFFFEDQVGLDKVRALSENLKRINKDVEVDALRVKLESDTIFDIFTGCDILIEAFDEARSKRMFVESMMMSGKFIVSASGLAGLGNSDDIMVRKLGKNLVVVGDFSSDVKDSPPLSPRVNIAAAKQADVVLEYVLNSKDI